ncbi:CRISPR-associated endonuclease Cas1 [Streptococcus sobrinus]|uniref:CRISPR-associated endonuclease Cas1 n=2 Tax=Streptococcus sobrinus TaxID=1310 RepID=UPI0002D308F6|nr:CRISPR-associated endonuclease Cas1 [Streptococcus sobrinus]
MSDLFIQDSSLKLSLADNRIVIKNQARELVREIHIDKVDSILLLGHPQITTQLLKKLSLRNINVYYFSKNGHFVSYLDSCRQDDFEKQEEQARAHFDDYFRLKLAQKIVSAKLRHQINLLSSFDDDGVLEEKDFQVFQNAIKKIQTASSVHEIMGYEGSCAKSYFYHLNLLTPVAFKFSGRSRRPAQDAFNSLLNLGYSLQYSFVIGAIKKSGLSLGFAMIHESHKHHAAFASDLMEEWRPVIVDNTVLSLIREGILTQKDFEEDPHLGIVLKTDAQKIFVEKLSLRMFEIHQYLEDDKKRYSFAYTLDMQLNSLIRAFKEKDPNCYLASYTRR